MERKELGKIKHASFGEGGYQDAMLGLSLVMGGESWGVGHFDGAWAMERSPHAQWSEQDRIDQLGRAVLALGKLLKDAKAKSVQDLIGKPVECTFDGQALKSFRILTEVIL